MFRIECFVEDNRLAATLIALAGTGARNVTSVPVVNAAVDKSTGKIVAKGNGSQLELFVAEVRKRKLKEIDATVARDIIKGLGFSETSYSHVLAKAIEAGLFKKNGKVEGGMGNALRYVLTSKGGKVK